MIIFVILVFSFLFFSSCMSELNDPDMVPTPEVCCLQSRISNVQRKDSIKQSRGWEGELGEQDIFPSTTYPMETLYLMVKTGRRWEALPIPIQNDRNYRIIDICYRADENGNVFAMSGENTIQIGPGKKCFFSSIPEIETGLEESNVIKTPNNRNVYEPYGDRLFRSDYINFSYDEQNEEIRYGWGEQYNPDYGKKIQRLSSIDMFRGTAVLIPRLVICDDYPKWEDGKPTFSGTSELVESAFVERLGPLENWSVRFFLAGKTEREGYPLGLDLDNFEESYHNVVVGYPIDDQKGIVALSENQITMTGIDHTLLGNRGSSYTYKGFGVHDSSFPFIYGIDSQYGDMDICCCIYHKVPNKDDPSKYETISMTLRFPTDDRRLSVNDIHTMTYVIDVDDVAIAFELGTEVPANNSRSIIVHGYDEAFGKIANIPAVVIKN